LALKLTVNAQIVVHSSQKHDTTKREAPMTATIPRHE
jgi:hypothetical protein